MRPFVVLLLLALCCAFCTPPADAQLFGRRMSSGSCANGSCGQQSMSAPMMSADTYSVSEASSAPSTSSSASVNADGLIVTPSGKVITELYGIPVMARSYFDSQPVATATESQSSCSCDCTPALEALTVEVKALRRDVQDLRTFYGENLPAESTGKVDHLKAYRQELVAKQQADRAIAMARMEGKRLALK